MKNLSGVQALVGDSGHLANVREEILTIAAFNDVRATTVITGETGTGKELVARAIHFESSRSRYPFMAINCGALPDGLLESELFGHLKGSFTGAVCDKKGLFEVADCGTIFLDEIAETSPATQVKLLRALQERTVRRVGGSAEIPINVRVIAATNKNLRQLVDDGKFREDLFYRLCVYTIHMLPLRERSDDILALARYFLEGSGKEFEAEALGVLLDHRWPGNVRELENAVVHAIGKSRSLKVVQKHHLPKSVNWAAETQGGQPGFCSSVVDLCLRYAHPITFGQWYDMLYRYTTAILERNGGNKKLTSLMLDIKRTTLLEYLKRGGARRVALKLPREQSEEVEQPVV